MSANKPGADSTGALSRLKSNATDGRTADRSKAGGTKSQATRPSAPSRQPSSASAGSARGTNAAKPKAPAKSGTGRAAPAKQSASRSGAPSRPTEKVNRPAPKTKVRRARLLASKIDPWSVLKMAFLLSVALGIVTVVAAIVLWTVLDFTGVFDRVNSMLGEVGGTEAFDLRQYAGLGQVASFATVVAVANTFLLTALSVLAAVLYNITATLVGGVGVTLTDD